MIVQTAKPWMSESDIEKGSRGLHEVAKALDGIKVGITCLTPENLGAPWILYEAGALAKAIDDGTRLCTYLLGGLKASDVRPPLGMFQATKAEREDTRKLVKTVNRALASEPIPEPALDKLFDLTWPQLEVTLKTIPELAEDVQPKRSPEDMLAEILEFTRAETNRKRRTAYLDRYESLFVEFMPLLEQVVRAARQEGLTALGPVGPPPLAPSAADLLSGRTTPPAGSKEVDSGTASKGG